VNYLQFPDDPFNLEPIESTASSSNINASWTPPQAGLGSDDILNLSNVFFGSESPLSDLQGADPLQPFDRTLSNVDDDFLQDRDSALFLNPSLEPFGVDAPNMADATYIGEPTLGVGVSESGFLFMNGPDDFTAVPNSTSSKASPMPSDPVRIGGIQPPAVATSLMAQDSEASRISDAKQVSNLPSPVEQYTCCWLGCQTPFNRLAELRQHVRSHAKMAQRCLWDGCQRLPEPTSSLKSVIPYLLNIPASLKLSSKHADSHTKPHICPEAGCGHRAAKLRDMRRHILSHGISNGAKVFYCPASNCQYNEGRTPFLRADNARRHIKQIHSGSTMDMITRNYNA
jgi:hypothetical protein